MRTAETVLSIIRERGQRGLPLETMADTMELHSRNRLLESYVRRKALMRSLGEGRWKSAYQGNSLAAYPTASTVLRGRRVSNDPLLPACGVDIIHSPNKSIDIRVFSVLSSAGRLVIRGGSSTRWSSKYRDRIRQIQRGWGSLGHWCWFCHSGGSIAVDSVGP